MLDIPKVTREEVAASEQVNEFESTYLPDGWYCFTITKQEGVITRAGQAMLNLMMAPCKQDKKSKTAVPSKELKHMTVLSHVADEEAFRADTAEKIAKEQKCEVGAVSDVDIAARVAKRVKDAEQKMQYTACAVVGWDDLPPKPRKDQSTGKYCDRATGAELSKEETNNAFLDHKTAARNVTIEIARDERNVVGYIVYGKVRQGEFRNKPQSEIDRIQDSLPDGEKLVPVSEWAPEEDA